MSLYARLVRPVLFAMDAERSHRATIECPRHFECKVEWTKEWAGRVMVVGEVVAASVDADCIDDRGYVLWERVRPAHYCGAPYGGMFVGVFETMSVPLPYDGPEAAAFHAHEQAMLKKT